ncbi:RES domain-containing protein [Cryobacterium sp. 10I1]|nr:MULTISPECIES: RES domain-containing protein [unclassified Cryobacterium]MEB0003776.1 RES domain-containing protein [Cryobacterium sp. RTC2.1]MEB0203621.1 RES domain-containing protein [Cryobacterium sp. 5I3]MEB0304479.1 RES domain-containing protein [Cryobacterium sp. 10I1]MEC5151276.1 RES domain-containing protein [Cryobacterium psychrotolerans]MDY7526362.1 RES domain-containing protein [Cryobacterium sp. 10C2]
MEFRVELFARIRRDARVEGLSIRELARRHGIDLADAVAPWQDIAKAGDEPSSWQVRRRLEALGANGLVDPSRKRPGLWHLTLFRWNGPDAPRVALQ